MKAIEIAKTFIGEKEKPGNGGFYNEKLQAIMTEAGHKRGEAWCCYFAEACFCESAKLAGDIDRLKKLRYLFSANCVVTFNNFKDAGFKISKTPVVGALVIFRKIVEGKPTTSGHAGICSTLINSGSFTAIEGNTNRDGGREGDSVRDKMRFIRKVYNGLELMGFVILEP